jgi:hypothetical protein
MNIPLDTPAIYRYITHRLYFTHREDIMSRSSTLASLFIAALLCASLLAASTPPTAQSLSQMPLTFTENMGQWDDRVLFRTNAGGATMWFTGEGVTYQFTRTISRSDDSASSSYDPLSLEQDSIEQLVLTARFVGANPNPEVLAEGLTEYICNYFVGNDPSKWHTDVTNHEAITLKDIYPGIDLKYSGGEGQATYEFIIAPGADIAQIRVEYEGAEETLIDADGRLILKTKWGDMVAGIMTPSNGVLSGFACFGWLSENSIRFKAAGGSQQASGTNAVRLSYSTYLGGQGDEYGYGIAVDGSGNAYVTGWTYSSDFPTLDSYQTYQGSMDAFVTKLSDSGNSLIYSTYLGGESSERGECITVDGDGNAYVTGWTFSSNFPILNSYQTYQGSMDAFVVKLSHSGNSLIYSTYLGGGSDERGQSIAVDGSGDANVAGYTYSSNFPTLNPYQTDQGGNDVFVTKFSSSGNSLIYSTYLGGGGIDYALSIAIDGSGNAYMTGVTYSSDFPTLNPYQTYQGTEDAFVTKLSNSGSSLVYSTYLGGGGEDRGFGIAVDGSGNAYVMGETNSTNFPTLNPYQTDQGGNDVFVTKLSSTGNSLVYSTYLGGLGEDRGFDIAIDGSGCAYVTGLTTSPNFPTVDPYQTYQASEDVFVTKLSNSGSSLVYSTYLGGGYRDVGFDMASDGRGSAYVTGYTESYNFPTANPYQTNQGGIDIFVSKLTDYICGDVNGDGRINLLDLVVLRNYVLLGVPAPQSPSSADVNCSGDIDISDVVYLANYYFRYGPAPCAACE